MSKPIADTLESLRTEIRRHDDLYYAKARPEISDQDYDALMRNLIELEAAHPELVTADSPSQRVGGAPIERGGGFASVKHVVRMMSIDNTYDEQGIRDFDGRVKKLLGTDAFTYTCEPKIDGVSLSIRYEAGLLKLAATRGNGTHGDDVTANAKTIRNIPLRLKDEGAKGRKGDGAKKDDATPFAHSPDRPVAHSVVEVRGEVFISRAQFAKINELQNEKGEEQYANPRNTAAGTLKQLDPKVVAGRKLEFLPHGSGEIVGLSVLTYHDWQKQLQHMGFRVTEHFTRCAGIEEVLEYIRTFADTRKTLPYDTDGVVVKIDNFDQRERLGVTAKAPRWCIAYKYQPEQAETELVDVILQVGKTGTVTPVAKFHPSVFISGTRVDRASLHNFDEIERKDIRRHDRVIVEKAGEVIPYVVGVVKEKRPTTAIRIAPPTECPDCHTPLIRESIPPGMKAFRCVNPDCELYMERRLLRKIPAHCRLLRTNRGCDWPVEELHSELRLLCPNPSCPKQLLERLRFFAGRNQMDIEDLGEAVIEALINAELIKSLPDLYKLKNKRSSIVPLIVSEYAKPKPRGREKENTAVEPANSLFKEESSSVVRVTVGEKRTDNILAGIEASKERGLHRLIAALGIQNIGQRTSQILAQQFGSLSKLKSANIEELLSVPEMGGGVLTSVTKLRDRYPICKHLSTEQIFGIDSIPSALADQILTDGQHQSKTGSLQDKLDQLRNKGVAAVSLFTFIRSDTGSRILDELENLGLKTTEEQSKKQIHGVLSGKAIVVTGTLTRFSRDEIKAKIDELGGKFADSVNRKTSFVIVGTDPGSKFDKAKAIGVEIMDEADFLRLIGEE